MPDDFTNHDLVAVEGSAQRLGHQILNEVRAHRPAVLGPTWWDEQILNLAMRDEAIKVQMFRFLDVLPMLHSPDAVVRHLQEYFLEVDGRLPAAVRWSLALAAPETLAGRAVAKTVRVGARRQARRFIAGANLEEVGDVIRQLRGMRRAFTLDILGEAVTSEAESRTYFEAYLALIRDVAPIVKRWPEVPQIDRDPRGPLPRTNISVKLSALDSQADEIDPAGSAARIAPRLRELLRVAGEHDAFVNIDMESYRTKDLILGVFKQVLAEDQFRNFQHAGIVIQCYLKDSERDLQMLHDWAAQRGTPICVRLVKGAYWDYESVRARSIGWPVPVFDHKWQTDENFERQCRFVLRHSDVLRPAIASHNIRSLAYSLAVARHLGIPQHDFELQMLYGMADAEQRALVEMGCRLRVYLPYGELIPGMAYLVRRLLENTSNESFLRATFAGRVPPEILLKNPAEHARQVLHALQNPMQKSLVGCHFEQGQATPPFPPFRRGGKGGVASSGDAPMQSQNTFRQTFTNEPPLDFANPAHRANFQTALDQVRGQMGRSYPLVIGQERMDTKQRLVSRDPSHKDRIVGRVASSDAQHAARAVRAALEVLPAWAALGAARRADYLRRVADEMRRRRFELAAWEVFECGKGWREADADVCEAIDYCRFYAAGALAMDQPQGVVVPGEENRFVYLPRGVAAVIAPWNFPLAILTGMTTAALATGNTVIMKPAEQSPVVAALLMELFAELDLPPGVLNYLPGEGEVAGAALVEHPDVALIAFTGSQQVGLAINARAAQASVNSRTGIKRVIAEMGGKNAIIIDDDADLDEAVLGVVKSAFGYQGQKCSACSRAIVLAAAYDTFLVRLVEATRSLKIGPAEDPSASVGPVIDEEALNKVRRYIAIGRGEAREVLSVDASPLADQGYFIGPHIFADVPPGGRLAQEEIFGPVLAVIRAKDLEEAIEIANRTPYALTGGMYSRSPANLERASRELLVGNLYLNRPCTGALVGRQPFGGFRMSGTGSKAGGPDYLLQFVVPKTITENTMRRGFAPASTV